MVIACLIFSILSLLFSLCLFFCFRNYINILWKFRDSQLEIDDNIFTALRSYNKSIENITNHLDNKD